ncbi:EamA family transporter [Shimia biformata]|uniref:EamA family transporter n=1 Tax=Shimia biformata TaxID=1294299 RepID=UPI00194EDFFB|nr:EamA family transporter [Shimia biformata]
MLIVVSVTLSALGQTAFKAGVDRISFAEGAGVVTKSLGFLTSPWILAGLAAYGVGTLFWLFALRQLDLSLAYPFVALSFVVVFLIGILFLGEPVVATRVIGLLIIIVGLVVMARA